MSQSQKLRENKNQHIQKNIDSKQQDVKIVEVVMVVLICLKNKYPTLEFGFEKKKMLRTIEKLINEEDCTTSDKSFIIPDGGFIWVKINGTKCYILVCEQKSQGTNDKRISEGKGKQGKGNAAERLAKNVDAMDILFGNEAIYPFVVFLQGCDFYDKESSIGDRIRTINKFQEMNTINLFWKPLQKHTSIGGSYFMRGHSMNEKHGTSDWTFDEMYTILVEVATRATDYYLSKYGKS
jgi:type II restriction enzyme